MKTNLFKRILAGLLSALMLGSMAACAGGGETAETTTPVDTTPAETEPVETEPTVDEWGRDIVKDDLPADLRFDGETLTFLTRNEKNCYYEFYTAESTGDIVGDSILSRNMRVEDRLGVKIEIVERPGSWDKKDEFASFVTTSFMAGDNSFDVVAAYAAYSNMQTLTDCYYNLADLPNVNYEKPWWNQSYINAATIHDQFFTVLSDLNLLAIDRAVGIWFNRDLAEEYQLGNLYEVALNGQWTIDKMLEITRGLAHDLNGNNTFDDADFYAITGTKGSTSFDPFFPAFNIWYTSIDSEGDLTYTLDVDRATSAIDLARSLFYDDNRSMLANERQKFSSGEAMFWITWLWNITGSRDMDDEYGLLPLPKYDENQENYYTTSQDSYNTMGVMRDAKNLEMIGAALELLSAETWRTVRPQYFENSFKMRYMRDSESGQIFDIVVDGIVYEHAILHNQSLSGMGTMHRAELNENRNRLASALRSKEKTFEKNLEMLNGYFIDRGNE